MGECFGMPIEYVFMWTFFCVIVMTMAHRCSGIQEAVLGPIMLLICFAGCVLMRDYGLIILLIPAGAIITIGFGLILTKILQSR